MLLPHSDIASLVRLIGYPGIFAIVFLESGVFFGFFLPGASMLFTAGILASQGFFNPWALILLVTVAAILGDNVGYWFGNKIGIKLFTRPNSRLFRHEHLVATQHFYEKHGGKAVFLGRFIPIVRTFAPIVAGIAHMRYMSFLSYNIVGALAWGAGVTFLGYFLGVRVPFVSEYLSSIILGIVFVTLMPLMWEVYKEWRKTE